MNGIYYYNSERQRNTRGRTVEEYLEQGAQHDVDVAGQVRQNDGYIENGKQPTGSDNVESFDTWYSIPVKQAKDKPLLPHQAEYHCSGQPARQVCGGGYICRVVTQSISNENKLTKEYLLLIQYNVNEV